MSNTPSSGNPDPSSEDVIVVRRPSRKLIVLGVIALALAFYIGTQVLGVLYGLISPPPAPAPAGVSELTHKNTGHGVDEWTYSTNLPACDVLQFYLSQNGTCDIAPTMCNPAEEASPNTPGQHVANCHGLITFSIFAMKWEVNIASGYGGDAPTRFMLSRQVYWSGTPPEVTPTP